MKEQDHFKHQSNRELNRPHLDAEEDIKVKDSGYISSSSSSSDSDTEANTAAVASTDRLLGRVQERCAVVGDVWVGAGPTYLIFRSFTQQMDDIMLYYTQDMIPLSKTMASDRTRLRRILTYFLKYSGNLESYGELRNLIRTMAINLPLIVSKKIE